MKWAYGVTTVPSRKGELLPRTLASLKKGGFPEPRLFVDGLKDPSDYDCFGLEVTARFPGIQMGGNWILCLWELLLRDASADFYAIFEDDFVTYKNLRQYLENCKYPEKGYWNLNTLPKNERKAAEREGWFSSDQLGKSAVALVFDKLSVTKLLGTEYLTEVLSTKKSCESIDGVIVIALKKSQWTEYVHMPSLVQHTGQKSTLGHKVPDCRTFKGEDFDATELLK